MIIKRIKFCNTKKEAETLRHKLRGKDVEVYNGKSSTVIYWEDTANKPIDVHSMTPRHKRAIQEVTK